ncbi:16S rRNA (guanine(966)-N(2))-methyltransferase RsmD [Marisediminicola sp. LYQ85]|uniref:16S rRNA (guanine(966)-N(2))-methyltransferase RsmD n=1 Tax=Marisediminicola sp. LYQ85 TaxID=3391062 RepID=UPI003983A9BA
MTRIIAGFAGSIAIRVPDAGTRPTSDRVREAIFSALESRDALDGARVLDLFAGSGALGLEAASRGARSVTLVEKNGKAAAVCRSNAKAVLAGAPSPAPLVEVRATSVEGFLAAAAGAAWDLVFLDPPYDLSDDDLARTLEALAPQLTSDAIVLVERSSRTSEPRWPAALRLDRRKDYGDTTLWWAGPARPAAED